MKQSLDLRVSNPSDSTDAFMCIPSRFNIISHKNTFVMIYRF